MSCPLPLTCPRAPARAAHVQLKMISSAVLCGHCRPNHAAEAALHSRSLCTWYLALGLGASERPRAVATPALYRQEKRCSARSTQETGVDVAVALSGGKVAAQ